MIILPTRTRRVMITFTSRRWPVTVRVQPAAALTIAATAAAGGWIAVSMTR
jgi:hypothetical protein